MDKPIPIMTSLCCVTCFREYVAEEGFTNCPYCKNLKYTRLALSNMAEADKLFSTILTWERE